MYQFSLVFILKSHTIEMELAPQSSTFSLPSVLITSSSPLQALHYMLLVSEVEETEIFKICLEYWNHLAAELYRESPFSTSTSPLLSGSQHFDVPPRRHLYLPVLSKVRRNVHRDGRMVTHTLLTFHQTNVLQGRGIGHTVAKQSTKGNKNV